MRHDVFKENQQKENGAEEITLLLVDKRTKKMVLPEAMRVKVKSKNENTFIFVTNFPILLITKCVYRIRFSLTRRQTYPLVRRHAHITLGEVQCVI